MGSEHITAARAAPPGRVATANDARRKGPTSRTDSAISLLGVPTHTFQQLGRAGGLGGFVLDLQRSAGNAAVAGLIHSVQRSSGCGCGSCASCGPARGEDGALVASRQADAGAPPACQPPGARRAPGSDADSVDQAVVAGCVPEAYGILNGHAMSGLLPLLDSLRGKGSFAQIRSTAAVMGGPRMETAIAAVDLKSRGAITGTDLRPLIDQMGTLPTDQRRDILRFLGKLVTITVQGIDIDFSYCKGAAGGGCVAEIKAAIAWAKKMQGEYGACRGKKGVKVAADVEKCVDTSLRKQGITPSVAGATSPSGAVKVTASPMTQCQPILDRGTEIHEGVHHATALRLQKQFGKGTPAFDKAWDDANGWIDDELNAYGAEIPFYQAVLKAIATLEKAL